MSQAERHKALKGMRDILPPDIYIWHRIEGVAREIFSSYGFQEIRTPIVEATGVFARSIGEHTDIVEKEMYTFSDKAGRSLTLRPEGTASVVRSYVENHLFYVEHWFHSVFWNKIREVSQIMVDHGVLQDIEDVWQKVNPDYPIDHRFLSGIFDEIYNIFRTMNNVLAGFAGVALTLALIGLFGLAAFMARTRTKEIGIRKVMGASVPQLVKMMLWQFSKPVMWAILIALPLSYLASGAYLNFFSDRLDISFQIPLILIGGISAVSLSWAVIALHAAKVAQSNPVHALHYE